MSRTFENVRVVCSDIAELYERAWLTNIGIATQEQVDDPNLRYMPGAVVPVGQRWKPTPNELIKWSISPEEAEDYDPSRVVRIVQMPRTKEIGEFLLPFLYEDYSPVPNGQPFDILPGVSAKLCEVLNYDDKTLAPTTTVTQRAIKSATSGILPNQRVGIHRDRWFKEDRFRVFSDELEQSAVKNPKLKTYGQSTSSDSSPSERVKGFRESVKFGTQNTPVVNIQTRNNKNIRTSIHGSQLFSDNSTEARPHHVMIDVQPVGPGAEKYNRSALFLPDITADDFPFLDPQWTAGTVPTVMNLRSWVAKRTEPIVALMVDHGLPTRHPATGLYHNTEAWAGDTDVLWHDAQKRYIGHALVAAFFANPAELISAI